MQRIPALLLLASLLATGSASASQLSMRSAQVDSTITKSSIVVAPSISYEHPVTKTVAEVKITGSTSYDDQVLESLSGLNVGDEIQIPGAALTSAVNRFLQSGYFSNVRVLVNRYEGNKVFLEIALTERPRRGHLQWRIQERS